VNALSKCGPFAADTPDRMADFTSLSERPSATRRTAPSLRPPGRDRHGADEARRQIERDLHDGRTQHLLALALRLIPRAAVSQRSTKSVVRSRIATAAGPAWSTSCRRSPAASIRRFSPARGCGRRCGRSGGAPRSPWTWTCGSTAGFPRKVEVGALLRRLRDAHQRGQALVRLGRRGECGRVPTAHSGCACGTTASAAPTRKRGSGLVRSEGPGSKRSADLLHAQPMGGGTDGVLQLPVPVGDGQPAEDPDTSRRVA